MRSIFDESYVAHDRDRLDAVSQDFPWAEIFERLDSGEGLAASGPDQSEAILRLMNLLLSDAQGTRINPKTVGLRLLAIGWVMNPANYPGSPSLRELARRCGVSAAALAFHTGAISRATGIRNRAQRHAGNWKAPERLAINYQPALIA